LQFRMAVASATAIGLLSTPVISWAGYGHAPQKEDKNAFFEARVRPVLSERCFSCHGANEQKGGLRLDSREGVLKGRGQGAEVVIAGDAENSRLVKAINYDGAIKMPPSGKLRPDELAALTQWVKLDVPWSDKLNTPTRKALSMAERKNFWSFRPIKKPALPPVKNAAWVKNPIDRFILAGLEAKGLKPAPPAEKRVLIRRAYFDLIGLPPTPDEVQAFLSDRSPNAFAKVIDHLLDSPRYGERWGRHWLDVARYADSNGLDENVAFANAYKYRDYVVAAFNTDKPYNEFVTEQVAGDLLPTDDTRLQNERLTAVGFLSLGAKVLAESDKDKMVMDIVDEQIEATSKVFMGLTVTCARCHDHKFDPIPTKDYYALAGIFKSTKSMSNLATVAMWTERPLRDSEFDAKKLEYDQKIADAQASFQKLKEQKVPAADLKKAEDELKDLQSKAPQPPKVMSVEEGKTANCKVHIRGDTQHLGDEVPRHFLTVLSLDNQPKLDEKSSGRLELAKWLTRPDHPLTSRVEVNRIWQGHFGEGIVRTPDNWGLLGEKPTNPALLDWLAAVFTAPPNVKEEMSKQVNGSSRDISQFTHLPVNYNCGWSIKKMHRLIMLSSTYQMSCANDTKASMTDPENRLQWRMNRRRLEAEPFRDSLLAVSGNLDRTIGGSLLDIGNHNYVTNDQSANAARYNSHRRAIYLPVIRNALYDMFQAFDVGDPSMVNAKRSSTTIAPQALFVMNSPFALEQSKTFAENLLAMEVSDQERVKTAYLKALSRSPTPQEIVRGLEFVASYMRGQAGKEPDAKKAQVRAWQAFCQVLFASNEYVYID
jgi:hypothetical protein